MTDSNTVLDRVPDPARQSGPGAGPSGALPAPPGGRRPRRRPSRRVAGLLSLGFFCAPALAFVAGVRAEPFEGRPLADAPSLADGWSFFDELSLWANDRLPLREQAVLLDAEIEARLGAGAGAGADGTGPAGVPTSAGSASTEASSSGDSLPLGDTNVLAGTDGRLFLAEDLGRTCEPLHTVAEVRDGARRLEAMLAASGRSLVVTLVPNKALVQRDDLPERRVHADCYDEAAAQRWGAITSDPLLGRVPLLPSLQTAEVAGPTYLPLDSHWTDLGSVTYVRELLDQIAPGLWDTAEVRQDGDVSYNGDLARLRGRPEVDTTRRLVVQRDGVSVRETETLEPYPGWFLHRTRAEGPPGTDFLPGRVLVLADSFGERYRHVLEPFVQDLTLAPLPVRATPDELPQVQADLVQEILAADLVVWEQVERTVFGQGSGQVYEDAFLDELEAALEAERRGAGS